MGGGRARRQLLPNVCVFGIQQQQPAESGYTKSEQYITAKTGSHHTNSDIQLKIYSQRAPAARSIASCTEKKEKNQTNRKRWP